MCRWVVAGGVERCPEVRGAMAAWGSVVIGPGSDTGGVPQGGGMAGSSSREVTWSRDFERGELSVRACDWSQLGEWIMRAMSKNIYMQRRVGEQMRRDRRVGLGLYRPGCF
jgi:hypothetical protein